MSKMESNRPFYCGIHVRLIQLPACSGDQNKQRVEEMVRRYGDFARQARSEDPTGAAQESSTVDPGVPYKHSSPSQPAGT